MVGLARTRRVLEAAVDALGAAGEDRAGLSGVVADGEDVVEVLADEFVGRLRPVARDADADALTYGVVSALLTTAGLPACNVPARRATKSDPPAALRNE